MIDSTKDVPKVLLESRDYQVFLRLLNLLTVSKKLYIDNMIRLLDPLECPSKYLPLLASYVGYDYDYTLKYNSSRIIIKYYPYLIRNRGTVKGIMLAVAVAISAAEFSTNIAAAMELVDVVYVTEDGVARVYIYYPNYVDKINDLIEVVRPIGIGTKVIRSVSIKGKDEIDVRDSIVINQESYQRMKRSAIDEANRMGHGEINGNQEDFPPYESSTTVVGLIIVKITGHSLSVDYDGDEHTITGYDVAIDNPEYTENDFTFSGTATASGTDVGTYSMGLQIESFTNTNPDFDGEIEFIVEDGVLEINEVNEVEEGE